MPRIDADFWLVGPALVASAMLVVRRDYPRLVWLGTLAVAVAVASVGDEPGRGFPAAFVALYTMAASTSRRWAVLGALVTMGVGTLAAVRSATESIVDPLMLAVLPWCGLAAAIGDAVRVNRQMLRDAQERVRVAEQTREEEALRRVAEERLHLSRELHDVIGHHLAVINVQAGTAEQLMATHPVAAADALVQVRSAAGEALQQTGRLVGLLRTADEQPLEPTPHLDRLPELVERVRAGGVEVVWNQRGPVTTGDPSVDQHGYRIVQEALTNASRHGTGPVALSTELTGSAFRVEVRNRVAAGSPRENAGSGHGIIGMRERAALCGGSVRVDRVGDQHVVRVELPVEEQER